MVERRLFSMVAPPHVCPTQTERPLCLLFLQLRGFRHWSKNEAKMFELHNFNRRLLSPKVHFGSAIVLDSTFNRRMLTNGTMMLTLTLWLWGLSSACSTRAEMAALQYSGNACNTVGRNAHSVKYLRSINCLWGVQGNKQCSIKMSNRHQRSCLGN